MKPKQNIGDILNSIFEKLELIEATQFDIIEFLLELKRKESNNDIAKTDSHMRLEVVALTKKKKSDKVQKE